VQWLRNAIVAIRGLRTIRLVRVLPGDVMRVEDTCNVWVIRSGDDAICIDFGSGAVLDRLEELGIRRITDVLVTHHHRDNVQGLARAVEAGARVWVPPVEQDLIAGVDEHWRRYRPETDYDVRDHRFSLLEPVAIAGVVDEYRTRDYGGIQVYALPTPGHTIGSVTYLAELGGRKIAFTGDLLYAPGKVWSVAATQWSYGGVEGQASTRLSCAVLARHQPDLLLPSHGEPMDDPSAALEATREALAPLITMRRGGVPLSVDHWLDNPWEELSPHLLRNRTSIATSFAVLSDTGGALIIDWGYDLWLGTPIGVDRAGLRPLLQSIEALRRNHGVERVEAVATTHYHDDHVAGINLLREVEGTEVWAPANVAPILEQPGRYDLPCLWFDPVPVDRVLELGQPFAWHEYEVTAHALPGHTLYAAALELEVDGTRVLATGDQQGGGAGDEPDVLNYQYRNRFRIDDYVESGELYARLKPQLLLTGHWAPRRVSDAYLAALLAEGKRLAELHRELLPLDDVDFGAEGFGARIVPYRSVVTAGESLVLEVEVRNPFARVETAAVELTLPAGWQVTPPRGELELPPHGAGSLTFEVRPEAVGSALVAADLTVGSVRFGQHAQALVDVR
jgi:glyoxylase-like metal-dependent hydrolase (beta-lactamase superfamily II)